MRRAAITALLLALALPLVSSMRQWLDILRSARELRTLPMDERRVATFGSWYRVLPRIPSSGRVDVVMADAQARDVAVALGASLSMRETYFFSGWQDWRTRTPATFLHDPAAANSARRPPTTPSPIVLLVDARQEPAVRILTPGQAP